MGNIDSQSFTSFKTTGKVVLVYSLLIGDELTVGVSVSNRLV